MPKPKPKPKSRSVKPARAANQSKSPKKERRTSIPAADRTVAQLRRHLQEAKERLAQAEETLRAIRSGDVDAPVVTGAQDGVAQVNTLKDAARPYQVLVEEMNEAVLTLSADGRVLYANARFAEMLRLPLDQVLGEPLTRWTRDEDLASARELIEAAAQGRCRDELTLYANDTAVPVLISLRSIILDGVPHLSALVADLTESKQAEQRVRQLNAELEQHVQERTVELQAANLELQLQMAARTRSLHLSQALHSINMIIHSTLDIDKIMQRTLARAAHTLGCSSAAISLRGRERWVVRYVHGLPQGVIGMEMDDDQEQHAVLAIQTQQAVAVDDCSNDPRVNTEHMQKWGIRSVLVIPLVIREQAIGVAFFNYQTPHTFQQEEIDFANTLAAAVVLALENARHEANLKAELVQRQKLAEQLSESERRANDLIRYAPTAIYEVDFRGPRFKSVNDAMCQMSGYSRDELLATSPFALLDDDSAARFKARIRKTLAGEPVDPLVEYRVRVKDGSFRQAILDTTVTHEEGKPVGAFVVAHDITERKLAEEVIRRLNQELEHRAQELEMTNEEMQTVNEELAVGNEEIKTANTQLQQANVLLEQQIAERRLAESLLEERNAALDDASQAAAQSEARWRLLTEAMPQVVWSADASGAMDYYNPWTYEYGGFQQGDINGWDWAKVMHPDDVTPTTAAWSRSLTTGEPYQIEQRLRRADGEYRWHMTCGLPIRDERGRIVRWIGTATDIHDQKRIETELREALQAAAQSEQKYVQLFQEAAMPAALTKLPENTFADVNAAFEKLVGYAKAELIGKTSLELGITRPEEFAETFRDIAQRGLHQEVEKHVRTKSGEERIVVLNASALELQGTRYALSTVRDVTDRRRAESLLKERNAELRKNQILLQAVLDGTSDPVYVKDRDSRILLANPALARVAGKPLEEIIGKTDGEYYDNPAVGQMLREHDLQVMASGESQVLEETVNTPDGYRTFLSTKGPYRGPSGEIIGTIGISRDITERKHAEEERERLLAENQRRATELESANRELDAFTYSVSHDLRTPLGFISSISQALLEENATPEVTANQRYLQLINDNAAAMTRLVEDLLVLSRSTRQPLRKQPVNMEALVREVQRAQSDAHPGRHIDWVVGTLPEVEADPVLLKQVWTNLISNAVKFTRDCAAARIEIGAYPHHLPLGKGEGEGVVYFVKDNGVGFDMEQADKLFGVFQRLHSADEYEGTGVGLAIVERIVRRHGGRVWAEAAEGKGATFCFTLHS